MSEKELEIINFKSEINNFENVILTKNIEVNDLYLNVDKLNSKIELSKMNFEDIQMHINTVYLENIIKDE